MIRTLARSTIEHFPALARFVRQLRDHLDQLQAPKLTPWGFTLAGHDAMANGAFEPEETRLVRKLIQDVDILVNVGANVGYYCCHALSLGKPIIAIEPNARNLHYLLKNLSDNGWAGQAQVFPVAVGRDNDIAQMWGGGTGASMIKGWASIPESYVTRVPVLCLDRVLGNALHGKKALILVDIEGAESLMLQGAGHALANSPRPIWFMEVATTENQPVGTNMNPAFARTFEYFFRAGYSAFTADDEKQEITTEVVSKIVAGHHLLRTHNFMFR